jgi:glycerol-3-phosphate dehydrogenase
MTARPIVDTPVLIVGGGVTGSGLLRDLALRGVPGLMIERGDVGSGASGANHGLLHSGARYVSSDPEVAAACCRESELLKRLAPRCVDPVGGLFAAVAGDDENFIADFPGLCRKAGLWVEAVDPSQAGEMEPRLSPNLIAAYRVADGAVDPFMIALECIAQAQSLGARYLSHTRATAMTRRGGRIETVTVQNAAGEEFLIRPDQVVNAAGAWSHQVAEMAGAGIEMLLSKGTLIITSRRLTRRVINRLRPPADGDILVPGGTVSIFGTTSVIVDDPDRIGPTAAEVDALVREGAAMIPALETTRYIRSYAGVRPLIKPAADADPHTVSREFTLLDHQVDGLDNFATITGGKLVTYRLMAEKTADLVCARLGVTAPCRTRSEPLPSTEAGVWSEPAFGPEDWLKARTADDRILCECELAPRRAVDQLASAIEAAGSDVNLRDLSRRSRIGKGLCQGGFCGLRVTAHLTETGWLDHQRPTDQLIEFLEERFKGQAPVLWGAQMVQAELLEALYRGLCGLDLEP